MKKSIKSTLRVLLAAGSLFVGWELICLLMGLKSVGWCPIELTRQLMTAMGLFPVIHTLVDYYTHIKGVEYVICIGFFVMFPSFYRYINKTNDNFIENKA